MRPSEATAIQSGSVLSTMSAVTAPDGVIRDTTPLSEATRRFPAASNATSPYTTGNTAYITGFVQPSADGNVIARFASEVASSAITAKAGSICRWVQVT